MTRGKKSSEKFASYIAFGGAFVLACLGVWKCEEVDLTELGVLIGAVTLPLMAYGGYRTTLKVKQGEQDAPGS